METNGPASEDVGIEINEVMTLIKNLVVETSNNLSTGTYQQTISVLILYYDASGDIDSK